MFALIIIIKLMTLLLVKGRFSSIYHRKIDRHRALGL